MGKKDKKKGKGAEKTAMKTEKKALNKMKKNLAAIGEASLEKLIAECQEKNKKSSFGEELCQQPTPRSGFTLCAHADKEELILFGGEHFNGSSTTMFDDLFFYNIKKDQWSVLLSPVKPPPRCSHQAVVVAQRGGQMWLFGGEFASPTRSSFYHYRDLWVFHFAERKWEQIKALGGPTARSGHRMVVRKKQILLFGGFHESLRDYHYYNDTYIFDLESYTWTKIEAIGKIPSPRSGFLMAPVLDGRIFVYGGYFREKVKKDVDKGVVYCDMYYLHIDERISPAKWKWVQAKPSGLPPCPRSGMSLALAPNNVAYCFGGVFDEAENEEILTGNFLNDLYTLDLESGRWAAAPLRIKSGGVKKRRRRRVREDGEMEEVEVDESEEVAESFQNATLRDIPTSSKTTYEDSIFTVTVGGASSTSNPAHPFSAASSDVASKTSFVPPARMAAASVIKNGLLYLFGGLLEDGDRQLTLADFYSLDIHKLDEWKIIVPFAPENLEWIESEDSDDDEEGDDTDNNDDMEVMDNDDVADDQMDDSDSDESEDDSGSAPLKGSKK